MKNGQERATTNKNGKEMAIAAYNPQQIQAIEDIIGECSLAVLDGKAHIERALTLAQGISRLRELISGRVLETLMGLQGTTLGFRTDRDDKGGYPPEVVRECAIDAFLRGAHVVGNELNIIAARPYYTKQFFARALRDFPGLTDLKKSLGVPRVAQNGKGALVDAGATWKLHGQADRLEAEIPVRINEGMGADAILGKADRKLMARIYARITGSEQSDGEIEDAIPIEVEVTGREQKKKARIMEKIREAKKAPKSEPAQEAENEPGENHYSVIVKGDTIAVQAELGRTGLRHIVRPGVGRIALREHMSKKEAIRIADGALQIPGPDGKTAVDAGVISVEIFDERNGETMLLSTMSAEGGEA